MGQRQGLALFVGQADAHAAVVVEGSGAHFGRDQVSAFGGFHARRKTVERGSFVDFVGLAEILSVEREPHLSARRDPHHDGAVLVDEHLGGHVRAALAARVNVEVEGHAPGVGVGTQHGP